MLRNRAEQVKGLKFLIVGAANTALMFALYWGLVELGLHAQLALAADYAVGILLGYVANRCWTFRDHGPTRKGLLKYATSYGAIYLLNAPLLWVFQHAVGMGPIWGQAVALVIATAASYAMQRFWVFKPSMQEGA